ncbi:hypothetical protein M2428_002134 [Arthrobacter sp. ES3-54]|nr:hypothetical protein [Arthrobacter sp. ES3-54]
MLPPPAMADTTQATSTQIVNISVDGSFCPQHGLYGIAHVTVDGTAGMRADQNFIWTTQTAATSIHSVPPSGAVGNFTVVYHCNVQVFWWLEPGAAHRVKAALWVNGSSPQPSYTIKPNQPAPAPTTAPAPEPTTSPAPEPTTAPAPEPTTSPAPEPTTAPAPAPTGVPANPPAPAPSAAPTIAPAPGPTTAPGSEPTTAPPPAPATEPTTAPTTAPTLAPITEPTTASPPAPTTEPALGPTTAPATAPATLQTTLGLTTAPSS